jgi:hypothetical protein
MCPAPGLHAGDMDGAFEDIAVLGFTEPAPLTGRFTGGAAGVFPTIPLAFDIARIGDEKSLAVPALTSSSSCHDSASPGRKSKRSGAEKRTPARGIEDPEGAKETKNDKCKFMKRKRRKK